MVVDNPVKPGHVVFTSPTQGQIDVIKFAEQVIELAKVNPNNMDLGKEARSLINK